MEQVDSSGNGIYGPVDNGVVLHRDALSGTGKIGNLEVQCVSPEWAVKFHTGYKLRAQDYHDVNALCQRLGIKLPREYQKENNV